MIDIDQFEERAAIMQFCGGMSRFDAETAAANRQGMKRWEVLDAIKRRDSAEARDQHKTKSRNG